MLSWLPTSTPTRESPKHVHTFIMLFALLIVLTAIAHVDAQIKGIALDLPESVADFALADLLAISPECTGEIRHIVNGKWRTSDLRVAKVDYIEAGPILCVAVEGLDIGSGYTFANSRPRGQAHSTIATTQFGVEEVRFVPDYDTLFEHYYEVLVSCDLTGKSGRYVACVDSGAPLSVFPHAIERLWVHGGGHVVMGINSYEHRSAVGTVRVKLLRKASPRGLDPETGAEIYDYEDLPGPVQDAVRDSDPRVVSKLEGDVAVIGLNLLAAWGLQVDAHHGLRRCGGCSDNA